MSSENPLSRRDFLSWLLKSASLTYTLPYVLPIEKALATGGQYKYFIGVVGHTLALLKSVNDVSHHGPFFQGYGNWRFNGPGSLSGLDSIKEHVMIPRGLTYRTTVESVGHFQAHGGFLTGYPSQSSSETDMLVGSRRGEAAPDGVKSIDWMIAEAKDKTPLALGYHHKKRHSAAEAPHFFNTCSWRTPQACHYPTFDAKALHANIQNELSCSNYTLIDRETIEKKITETENEIKVLEKAAQEYSNYFRNNRQYANAYEGYIDDFQKRAQKLKNQDLALLQASLTESQSRPSLCDWSGPQIAGDSPNLNDRGLYRRRLVELNHLVSLAFKSNYTNAATLVYTNMQYHTNQHDIAKKNDRQRILGLGRGLRDYMDDFTSSLVDLVSQLRREGIFQDTLILVGGEQSDGNAHSANEAPVLIIDGKNGSWNGREVGDTTTGQTAPETRPYATLLVDILRRFGINVEQMGSNQNVRGVGTGGLF